ncbi:ABC transporter permease [Indioceanicola profundi]|uniref:ABC transporter permease n=1 Tax=Indioceanicola profundi TaxID=2220096 RepID=UPI000E6AC696|nr:ABC transporter permease [Indioceanicola profundi]
MIHRIRFFAVLLRAFLLHRLRERQTRISLLLLPVFAFLGIGAYKLLIFGDVDLLPELTRPSYETVLVDAGGAYPGLGFGTEEALRRIGRDPRFTVTIFPSDPGDAPLHDREADLIVAVRDGRVHVASATAHLATADLLRDLLLHGGGESKASMASPSEARYDVRFVPADIVSASGMITLLPFYFVLMLAGSCGSTGAAAFVADQRKGMLRHFLLTPVGQTGLISANALAVAVLALLQSFVLLAVVAVYGEVPRIDLAAFTASMAAGAALLTALGFAAQSFKPAENASGGGLLMITAMILSMFGMQYMMLAEPDGEVAWMLLANPFGALMDLVRQALTGGAAFNPAWMSYAVVGGWTVLAGGIAAGRFAYALEPDWTRR